MSFKINQSRIDFYKTEGYLILRSVFKPYEIDLLARDVDRLSKENETLKNPLNMRVRFKNHFENNSILFETFDPISDLSKVAKDFTNDPRILDVLEQIYGEPAQLFKDKLIYKPAGAIGATLHQDWIGWPGFPESFLTVLVAIDSFDKINGATEVYPRCHHGGYLSPKDGKHYYLEEGQFDTKPVPLELNPGDIAIFGCFVPHRSAPNTSNQTRRGYFISYNATSDGGYQFEKHYNEFHDWIRSKSDPEKRPLLFFK